jgi:hypothetical protein
MLDKQSLDHRVVLAWTGILLIMVEWGSYYFQTMINFFNFSLRLPWTTILSLALVIFVPIFLALVTILGIRWHRGLMQIARIFAPVLCIAAAVCLFIFYLAYFQLNAHFEFIIPNLTIPTQIVGLIGSFIPQTEKLFMTTNILLMCGVVPILFAVGTRGTGVISINREMNFGAGIFALYMLLRWGSIGGTPYRLAIVFLFIGLLWLVPLNQSTESEQVGITFKTTSFRFYFQIGILGAFIWAAPAYSAQGFLGGSWVWIGGLLGLILVELIRTKRLPSVSLHTGKWITIGINGMIFLLILGNLWTPLRWIRQLLLFGLLFGSSLLFMIGDLIREKNTTLELPKPIISRIKWLIGMWIFLGFVNLTLLFPYLVSLSNVLSEAVVVIYFTVIGIINARRSPIKETEAKQ